MFPVDGDTSQPQDFRPRLGLSFGSTSKPRDDSTRNESCPDVQNSCRYPLMGSFLSGQHLGSRQWYFQLGKASVQDATYDRMIN